MSPFAFNLPQNQGLFQWVSCSHQVAEVLKFNFSISPSNEYSGFISLKIDWFDLFADQGTLKHHNSKASVLWCSAFFIVQSIHDSWKDHRFDCMSFVGKVVCLLFNTMSRFVVAFLPKSKCLLISCLHSPSSYFGAQEEKICQCFYFFPLYLPWSDITRCHYLRFLNIEF